MGKKQGFRARPLALSPFRCYHQVFSQTLVAKLRGSERKQIPWIHEKSDKSLLFLSEPDNREGVQSWHLRREPLQVATAVTEMTCLVLELCYHFRSLFSFLMYLKVIRQSENVHQFWIQLCKFEFRGFVKLRNVKLMCCMWMC